MTQIQDFFTEANEGSEGPQPPLRDAHGSGLPKNGRVIKRLELLSVAQLKNWSRRWELFLTEVYSLHDRPGLSIKQQLILVLDEADPKELLGGLPL